MKKPISKPGNNFANDEYLKSYLEVVKANFSGNVTAMIVARHLGIGESDLKTVDDRLVAKVRSNGGVKRLEEFLTRNGIPTDADVAAPGLLPNNTGKGMADLDGKDRGIVASQHRRTSRTNTDINRRTFLTALVGGGVGAGMYLHGVSLTDESKREVSQALFGADSIDAAAKKDEPVAPGGNERENPWRILEVRPSEKAKEPEVAKKLADAQVKGTVGQIESTTGAIGGGALVLYSGVYHAIKKMRHKSDDSFQQALGEVRPNLMELRKLAKDHLAEKSNAVSP